MTLTTHKLSCRLALLAHKLRLLAFDPGQPGNDKQAYSLVIHLQWSSHTYTARRGIHTKMKVFDVLANHINDKPMYRDLVLLSTHLDSLPVLKFDRSGSHLSERRQLHFGLLVPCSCCH